MTEEESISVEFIYCYCNCGFTRPKYDKQHRLGRYITGHNGRGKKPWNYKGRSKMKTGYVRVLVKNHPYADKRGYVMEHRLVMEKHLGRYLDPKEKVHHDNKHPDDNRIENLQLHKSHSDHMKKHHWVKIDMSDRRCAFCGGGTTWCKSRECGRWHKTERPDKWKCSRCYGITRRRRKGWPTPDLVHQSLTFLRSLYHPFVNVAG